VFLATLVPAPLKRRLQQEARLRGWSTSSEVCHRLLLSLDREELIERLLTAARGEPEEATR
jgi:hypothetical protein